MSSTFVADSTDDKDDSLIIIVNSDGTITVDPETLQKLIANQHGGNVSVVRVDGEDNSSLEEQTDPDASHVNLTVEGFYSQAQDTPALSEVSTENDSGNSDVVVDPFSQMDPEHIARLESALQSEQAKEILGHKLGDNLNEMLDILERSDNESTTPLSGSQAVPPEEMGEMETIEQPLVHNDHSYTTVAPIFQSQPSAPTTTTPANLARPLMRGGRARVRGTGRILTRGGLSRTANTNINQPQPNMVSNLPKNVPKSIIIAQGGRLVQQPAVASDLKVQKKVVTNKLQPVGAPRVNIANSLVVNTANTVVVRTSSDDSPKKVIRGKLPVKIAKGKKGSRVTPDSDAEKLKQQLEDEIDEAHSPIPKIDPTIPNADKKLTFQQVVTILKKKPSVVIQKLSAKVVEASLTRNNVVVRPKPKEAKPEVKSPLKIELPPPTPPPAPLPSTPTTTKPVKQPELVEESKKKKDKGKGATPTTPIILGPELFSTPDIIRRVSTDKTASVEPSTEQPTLQSPTLPPVKETPSTPPKVEPEPELPKVQVQPLHPPLISTKCAELSDESLLDSIHAEVAKDESRFLDEALLFDDLSNDEDAMGAIKIIDSQIEETLEKMEFGAEKPLEDLMPGIPAPATTESSTPLSTTPSLRKLPPIELPTTRSATKKAAAVKVQDSPNSKEKPQKVAKPDVKRSSVESRKSVEKKTPTKDEDSDFDDAESDDESWNSEDDPDRLWCICKKPHNNRFMICCDSCEEWFHGKCVGITKALGQQMEDQGVEWTCPNCKEAKKSVAAAKAKSEATPPQKTQKFPLKSSSTQQIISSLECMVCKKPAKAGSNFCGDICIKKHVLTMLAMLKKETVGLNPATRIVVYEKKTGRLLSGEKAPTVVNLADWLMSHRTFEVVKPSILPLNKYYKSSTVNKTPTTPVQKPAQPQVKSQPQKTLVQSKLTTQNKIVGVDRQVIVVKEASGNKIITSVKVDSPKNTQTTPKLQMNQKIVQASPKVVQGKILQPNQKTIQIHKGVLQTQKTIQIIQPQLILQTPPAKKEEGEKTRKKSVTTPASPVLEKKKDEKPEVKVIRKDRKSKDGESKSSSTPVKQEEPVKQQPEPIRSNVKRTLQELLHQRVQQDAELNIPLDEIKELVSSIEEELFNLFKDTGAKYKSKYRSLVFNIKDAKNLTLYKKIVEKSVSPSQLVRLTPEELASQELAQWREKEAKHQIEIIKKNELDLIHQAKTVVLKSRKGEEVIESKNHEASITELESALNRTAEDYEMESAKNDKKDDILSPTLLSLDKKKDDKKDDRKKDKKRDKKKSHRSRSRTRRRSRSKERRRSKSKESKRTDSNKRRSRSRSRQRSQSRSKDRSKSRDRKRKDSKSSQDKVIIISDVIKDITVPSLPEPKVEEVERSLTPPPVEKKLKEDDLSDREPSSTVTINTPPYTEEKPSFWSGILNMSEVTKLYTSAYEVSGSCEDLDLELSKSLECVGRIQPDAVWDYVSRMKKAGTKDIVVIRFQSDSEEEKMNYLSLYSYLNSRNRMAVIGSVSKSVKDFYVLPLASHSPIPQVLLPLDGPGFDDYRPHLLLGIIIRTRKGNSSISSSSSFSFLMHKKKSQSSKVGERSYTPPLPDGSTTPPLPPSSALKRLPLRGLTPPLPDLDDEPYSPGEDDPYSPEDMEPENVMAKSNPDLQMNLEDINRMIEEKRQKIESMTTAAALPPNSIPGIGDTFEPEDETEAYSPSSRLTPPPASEIPFFDSKSLPDIKLPSNLQEILASIKGPESVNGQTRPMDVNSDPIVKAYSSGYLEEDEDKSEDEKEVVEKSNRDPRQRPEKIPKTSLSQLSDAELIRKAAEMEEQREAFYQIPPPVPQVKYPLPLPFAKAPISVPPPLPTSIPPSPLRKRPKESSPPKEFPPHKDFEPHKSFPHKEDYDRRRRWEQRPSSSVPHRGGNTARIHPRGTPLQPNFRRGFERGRPGPFRGRFNAPRRASGNAFRGPMRPNKFDGLQNEWDEEIRNFEQRKVRELDRERRKRRPSRSPSPSRRRRQKRNSTSSN